MAHDWREWWKDQRTGYAPPPEEIARQCLEIQDSWAESERLSRAGFHHIPELIECESFHARTFYVHHRSFGCGTFNGEKASGYINVWRSR